MIDNEILKNIKQKNQELELIVATGADSISTIAHNYEKMEAVASQSEIIISDIDKQFDLATGLNKNDKMFLFLAVALQCVRQYVIGRYTERKDDKSAAGDVKGDSQEKSNRHHRYYNPSLLEVMTNPVPFDANVGANGALTGGGKRGHRISAIGHDPILGLVFGTANIATSTLTNWKLQSYHIKTGMVKGRNGTMHPADVFGNKADTKKVLEYTKNKLLCENSEKKIIVVESLRKEIVHLRSDIYTKNSLPFPFVSVISPEFANTLADYGIDAANIVKVGMQGIYANFINQIIAILHGMCFDESLDGSLSLYQTRTRKILSYSNVIASSSNVIATAVAAVIGYKTGNKKMVEDAIHYLDIGGLVVTLQRIVSDKKFIYEVQKEFMKNQWYEYVENALEEK